MKGPRASARSTGLLSDWAWHGTSNVHSPEGGSNGMRILGMFSLRCFILVRVSLSFRLRRGWLSGLGDNENGYERG